MAQGAHLFTAQIQLHATRSKCILYAFPNTFFHATRSLFATYNLKLE